MYLIPPRIRPFVFAVLVGLIGALLLAPQLVRAEVIDAGEAATLAQLPVAGSEPAERVELPPLSVIPLTLPKDIPDNIESLGALGQWGLLLIQAVRSKDWQFLVGLLLILSMLGLRKFASFVEGRKDGWMGAVAGFFGTQFGGTVLLFLSALLGGLGSAAVAHVPWSFGLFLDAGKVALLAAGGWSALVKSAVEWWKARRAAATAAVTSDTGSASSLRSAVIGLVVLWGGVAYAISSYGVFTKVTLPAATATKLVAPADKLLVRRTIAVANCDTARIWCAFDSSVSATSWPVEPSCGKEVFDLGPEADLWCYSMAGTAADAVRVIQTR